MSDPATTHSHSSTSSPSGESKYEKINSMKSLSIAQNLSQSEQPSFSFEEVAAREFPLTGLFDVIYIDLRGKSSRADILSAFSSQLALRGNIYIYILISIIIPDIQLF